MLDRKFLDSEAERILNKLVEKNLDYGDSFFELMDEYGFPAFTIRLTDKLVRIKTIHKKGKVEVKSESIEDTVDDIIGYCFLYKYYKSVYSKQTKVYFVIREEEYGEIFKIVGVYFDKEEAEAKKEIEEATPSFESDRWKITIEKHVVDI